MSEVKFTQGPWVMATSNSYRRIVADQGHPVCVPVTQKADGHPDLHFPNGGHTGPDASLMLAAPELYEALERLLGDISGEGEYVGLRPEYAHKALAKARGEQP